MKRILAFTLAVVLCFGCAISLSSCFDMSDTSDGGAGNNNAGNNNAGGNNTGGGGSGGGTSATYYTLTFETNGGSAIDPMKAAAGSAITAPAAPTKEDCNFAGWYIDASCTLPFTFAKMPFSDMTLYAKWSSDPVILFETDGGSAVAAITAPAGSYIEAPADPTKAGYDFLGWMTADDEPFYFGFMPSESMTLYAMWEKIPTEDDENGGGMGEGETKQLCQNCFKNEAETVFEYGAEKWEVCFACKQRLDALLGGGDGGEVQNLCEYCHENEAEDTAVIDGVKYAVCLACKAYDSGDDVEDTGKKYTVTFEFVDMNGKPMKNKDGKTNDLRRNIKWGKDAKSTYVNNVTAFDDYVIIGWNADLEQAKAGVVDENCTKSIKQSKTVYSVVREKKMCEVTLYTDEKTVFDTVFIKEGDGIEDVERPTVPGKYFVAWGVQGESSSKVDCIRDNCAFVAVYGNTDGTIGKVPAGTITVDGYRDDAYNTSGAYLPLNTALQADRSTSPRAAVAVKADAYLVWDGDYIYMLVEVYDTTLIARNEAYRFGAVDAYLNDAVEVWYNFEQDISQSYNETRVGLDAMAEGKYALPRSVYHGRETGIGGGRSTYYDDIKFAGRCYLKGDMGSDLSTDGVERPSYILEFAFPAFTEGTADTSKGANAKTGLLPGCDPSSNDPDDYAFLDGTKLKAGDFVRFNLVVNDLMLKQWDLIGRNGAVLWDCPPQDAIDAWGGYDTMTTSQQRSMLYATDGNGNIMGPANVSNKFSAAGNTQRDLRYYIMFSLGGDQTAETKVWSLGKKTVDGEDVPVMLTRDGHEYIRPID